jgi:hypothetical protein
MKTEVIIKRQKFNTYHEEDTLYNKEGQKLTAPQSNLNVRNRWGSKEFNHKGKVLKVIKWEFYNSQGEFIKSKNV